MAKSKETYNKKEKEKKKLKQRQEKKEKMEERKTSGKKSFEDMIAYIDENGNISDTPPDPRNKKIINAEDIQIGVVRPDENEDPSRSGTVSFFDDAKGFGFINDRLTQERIFVHINSLSEPIQASDKVTYEVESGPRGPVAVNVKKTV